MKVCFLLPCGKSPTGDLVIRGRYQGICELEGDEAMARVIPRSNEMRLFSGVACDLHQSCSSGFMRHHFFNQNNCGVGSMEQVITASSIQLKYCRSEQVVVLQPDKIYREFFNRGSTV
jgi:hypothetical protein